MGVMAPKTNRGLPIELQRKGLLAHAMISNHCARISMPAGAARSGLRQSSQRFSKPLRRCDFKLRIAECMGGGHFMNIRAGGRLDWRLKQLLCLRGFAMLGAGRLAGDVIVEGLASLGILRQFGIREQVAFLMMRDIGEPSHPRRWRTGREVTRAGVELGEMHLASVLRATRLRYLLAVDETGAKA